jgi:hypothetical protein
MPMFELQFPMSEIEATARRYDFRVDDDVAAAGSAARDRGYYNKSELVLVCEWKTARSKSRVAANSDAFVEGITRAAFGTADEAERMAALCAMRGVDVPTASVLLHFAFPSSYPIIDWRALQSLGQHRRGPYSIPSWLSYVESCRNIAEHAGVTMRTLDKALWQHSREQST